MEDNMSDAELPAFFDAPDLCKPRFRKELEELINRHGMENGSDTPDFILADYLASALAAFDAATAAREKWYGRGPGEALEGPSPE